MSDQERRYATEKLGLAQLEIATAPDHEKLRRAWRHLTAVQPGDFPSEELRLRYAQLLDSLTSTGRKYPESIYSLSNDRVNQVSREIQALYWGIQESK